MNSSPITRRRLVLAGAALAAGCVSLGEGLPARQWHVLDDLGAVPPVPAGDGPRIAQTLLIGPVEASGFDESVQIAYSRSPGTRSHYQFSGWTDRPGRRIAWLVERRLGARGRFAAVAQGTSGLRPDLVLNLALEHLYHDASANPGSARVALDAELVAWRERTRVARRRFERVEPVAAEAAASAAAAINRALTGVLDELAPWVEAAAASRR